MENKNLSIQLKNVSKTYTIYDNKAETIRDKVFNILKTSHKRKLKALSDINLEVKKGEFFGIIGHNGSGKSTLINIMTKSIPPDKGGTADIYGKYIKLSLGLGFNPQLTARQNVFLNSSLLGIPRAEIKEKFDEIIDFAEMRNFVNTPIKYYSRGMKSKLAFSVAIHAKAEIFLMDEFFGGVGDMKFKKKANKVFENTILDNRTIIHVSHNLTTIRENCQRVLVLNQGNAICIEEPEKAIREYQKIMK